MVARAMTFIKMLLTVDVEQVELVDEPELLKHVECSVDGDAVDAGVHLLRALENGAGVQMALGVVHHLKQDATLACEADAAFRESRLKASTGHVGI